MLTHRVSIGEETETKIILNKDWRKGFLLLLSYSSATFTRKLIKEPFLLRLCLSVEIKVPQLRVRGYLKKNGLSNFCKPIFMHCAYYYN